MFQMVLFRRRRRERNPTICRGWTRSKVLSVIKMLSVPAQTPGGSILPTERTLSMCSNSSWRRQTITIK